jgi:CDP-4-dehydro-6-deoxyglucose reductase
VHEAVLNDFSHLTGHEVYACGPPPMVHAVRDTLIERGLPEDFIYSDSFEIAPKK